MALATNRIKNAYNEWAEIYDTNDNKTRDLNYRCIRQQQLDLRNKKIPRLLKLLFKKEA